MENIRERFFGPSYELMSHDKVSNSEQVFVLLLH